MSEEAGNRTAYILPSAEGNVVVEFRLPDADSCHFDLDWTQMQVPPSGHLWTVTLDDRILYGEHLIRTMRVHAGNYDTAEPVNSTDSSRTHLPIDLDSDNLPATLAFAASGLTSSTEGDVPSFSAIGACEGAAPALTAVGHEVFPVSLDHFEGGVGIYKHSFWPGPIPTREFTVQAQTSMGLNLTSERGGFWLVAGYEYGHGLLEVSGPGLQTTYQIEQGPPLVHEYYADLTPGHYEFRLTEAGEYPHLFGVVLGFDEPSVEGNP